MLTDGLTSTTWCWQAFSHFSDEKFEPTLTALVQLAIDSGVNSSWLGKQKSPKLNFDKQAAEQCIVWLLERSPKLRALADALQPFSEKPCELKSFKGHSPRLDTRLWEYIFKRATTCESLVNTGAEYTFNGVIMWAGGANNKAPKVFTPIKVRSPPAHIACAHRLCYRRAYRHSTHALRPLDPSPPLRSRQLPRRWRHRLRTRRGRSRLRR